MPVLTVSQFSQAIKLCLESAFPYVSLQGEVSNFTRHSSGHLYFSLKDAKAQIAAVMFKADALQLKVLPKAGDQVIVKGEINVYPLRGNYQIVIRELAFAGLGELLLKLEQLKIKLHKMGWFKADRKKPLPKFPKKIGIVTSPTGAAIQDVLNILTRRFSGFHLILNPVKVQGEGAAQEIAKAIDQFNRYSLADVLIVGRGGGSLEDLWAFNEEIVAKAIFNSSIPILTAVGHETDHCIADYVADMRAPTPSAAAELVIAEKKQCLDQLRLIRKRAAQSILHTIKKERQRIEGILKQPVIRNPKAVLTVRTQRLDEIQTGLEKIWMLDIKKRKFLLTSCRLRLSSLNPSGRILHFRQRLDYWIKALKASIENKISACKKNLRQKVESTDQACLSILNQRKQRFRTVREYKKLDFALIKIVGRHQERLNGIVHTLRAIDPKNLLGRGYSILFSEKDHSVISSVHSVKKNEMGRLLLADGEVILTFNEIFERERQS